MTPVTQLIVRYGTVFSCLRQGPAVPDVTRRQLVGPTYRRAGETSATTGGTVWQATGRMQGWKTAMG